MAINVTGGKTEGFKESKMRPMPVNRGKIRLIKLREGKREFLMGAKGVG